LEELYLREVETLDYGLGIFSGELTGIGNQLSYGGDTVGWHSQMIYLPDRQITTTVLGTQLGSVTGIGLKNLEITVQQS
jgi:hypothetical protein